jgi:hypothetical protein
LADWIGSAVLRKFRLNDRAVRVELNKHSASLMQRGKGGNRVE